MELNHKQLTFAREYRGYSQTDLASKIPGLSQSNLSKFEKGLSTLSDDLKMKIVDFLNFPAAFFCQKISNTIENPHYRKRSTLNKTQVAEIDRSIKLIGYIIDQMAESIEWPEIMLTPLDVEEYSPENSAKYTRKLLGLTTDEPVRNICTLLEKKGIIIVFIDFPEKFDGVSVLTDSGYPVMIINKKYPDDRKRFTIAHELGHLIMHVIGGFPIPDSRENSKESEADRFASEFLMPADAIENSLRRLKLSNLHELKRYWLTSMASIVRRARDLKCINQEWYTYLNIEMSRMGLKKDEKYPVFIDDPKLFELGYKMHKKDLDYSDKEMAEAFRIPIDVLERFCGDLSEIKLRVVL